MLKTTARGRPVQNAPRLVLRLDRFIFKLFWLEMVRSTHSGISDLWPSKPPQHFHYSSEDTGSAL